MLNLFLQERKVHCELLLPKPVAYLRCKTWLMNPNTQKQKKSASLISCIDNSIINCVSRFMGYGYLDAPRHLCKRVCLSVRPSVSHAISSRCVQGATFAVYPAWSITWASILLSHIPQKSISPINIIGGALDSLQRRFRSIKKRKKFWSLIKYRCGQILDCRRSGRATSWLNKLVELHHMVIYPSIPGRPRYLT